ncbi:hypothetical protein DL98DRAFT_517667 [Cadophora sp. DSE1049]|nr:hypothetical protein DL98DRAFT_517667 [Cadophora sp. DSE1049]
MVRVLLELSSDHVYSLPHALPRLKAGPRWPAAPDSLGRIQKSRSTTIITPLLVESYVAVLEAFLAAGIDPTDIPSNVPPDYLLCRKSFEHDLFRELSSLTGSMSASILFHLGKLVFDRSVCAHNMKRITGVAGNYKSETPRKRKFIDESEAGESSRQPEQEGDNGQGVEFVAKDKRLKPFVEQGVVFELSDDNDVIFLGERPVHRDQRVEVKEDD